MSKFGTKGTKVSEGGKFLQPGISIVALTKVEGASPEGKSPYLDLIFKSKEGQTGNVRLYMSEKAMEKSNEKLAHIATSIIGRDGIDAISSETIEDYGNKLTAALKEKAFRMKFTGKETIGGNGNKYINIAIGLPVFAEKLDVNPTKLKYDPNNNYDLEKVQAANDGIINEFTNDAGLGQNSNDNDIF
jgi:hypothetical protein